MSEEIEEKYPLNSVTHTIRSTQLVLQYGVGATVDFPDQTLATAAPEYWGITKRIYDERLARLLNVNYFRSPEKVAYVRFPEWYFCPRCRKFKPLKDWIHEYRAASTNRSSEDDPYMVRHMRCPKCGQELVASSIVTACPDGHLNDFPWVKWVHAKSGKGICEDPQLLFEAGGYSVKCSTCGARANLQGAFGEGYFEGLQKTCEGVSFYCEGNHPFRHVQEDCRHFPQVVQTTSSNVYFPLVYGSLVIPPYADELNIRVQDSESFEKYQNFIDEEDPEDRLDAIRHRLPKWTAAIANEIGAPAKEVEAVLNRKWLSPLTGDNDDSELQYRIEEYAALNGTVSSRGKTLDDFSRREMDISEYRIPHIKSIALIDKVRVVHAHVGFSRLEPVPDTNSDGFVCIKEPMTNWYPAYEVRGEGIFIELNSGDIDQWVENTPAVSERIRLIESSYANSRLGKSQPRAITPKFVMLHTLSHLLISQLSFECGYNIASLSERLYCSEESDGQAMAGIFIYTASGDSEGTLGGLVRQGCPDTFPSIFKKAIDGARTCSNDPVCAMSHGQGHDSLNLSACYACALLPETSCEEYNSFLDRGVVIGTYDDPEIGFWSNI